MRLSRFFFLLFALIVSGSLCASLWARSANARRAHTATSALSPVSRPSGPGVTGYTLVNGISLGASKYCALPGERISLIATVSGKGNDKVRVGLTTATDGVGQCDAKPGDSCTVEYTLPMNEGTVSVTATARGNERGAETKQSNIANIEVKKKLWSRVPELVAGDLAPKYQSGGQSRPAPPALPEVPPTQDSIDEAPTQDPEPPAPPYEAPVGERRYAPGAKVSIAVSGAEDKDTCSHCGTAQDPEADEIKYKWTKGFAPEGEQTDAGSSIVFTMPATEGETIELEVEVDDKAEVGEDAGTGSDRDDPKATLKMKFYAAYANPNDPDSDGDGLPDSMDDDDDNNGTLDKNEPNYVCTRVHGGWASAGVVSWADPRNPTISPAKERCVCADNTPGHAAELHDRAYVKIDEYYRKEGDKWTHRVAFRAEPGCPGASVKPDYEYASLTIGKTWSVERALQNGAAKTPVMVAPQDRRETPPVPAKVTVAPKASVPVQVEVATDEDNFIITSHHGVELERGAQSEEVKYKWSAKNSDGYNVEGFGDKESRQTTWNAPETPGIYTLTCTTDDPHRDEALVEGDPKPTGVAEGDSGDRNDKAVVESVDVRVGKAIASLRVLDREGKSAGETIGGPVTVALELDLDYVDIESHNAVIRLKEKPDTDNGVTHGAKEDHIDLLVNFDDAAGWQQWRDPDGDGPQEANWNTATSKPDGKGKWRWIYGWNTAGDAVTQGTGANALKLWNHNGAHTVSLAKVDGVASSTLNFGVETVDIEDKDVKVGNLVITDVSTSNGTEDYFKFNPTAEEGSNLLNPTVNFTIQDEGDSAGHAYRWRVRVRSTDIEDQTTSVVYEDIALQGGAVVVPINQARLAADSPLTMIKDWGTYNFNVSIHEYASETDARNSLSQPIENGRLDTVTLRSADLNIPYTMPAPNQSRKGHDLVMQYDSDGSSDLRLSYLLGDNSRAADNTAQAKELKIELIPPTLGDAILTETSWPRFLNSPVLDRLYKHFESGELVQDSTSLTG